jgi:DNA repair protein RAD50
MLEDSLKDQRARLAKARESVQDARFDDKIDATQTKTRQLEDLREKLSAELRILSLDADKRARLDIKRAEQKRKGNEAETM